MKMLQCLVHIQFSYKFCKILQSQYTFLSIVLQNGEWGVSRKHDQFIQNSRK